MIGEQLLNYEIKAQKQQDEVFQAFLAGHTQFDKQVIIKTFTPEFLHNLKDKTSILDDIKRLARVQHPHIVTFYDYLEQEGKDYLFFEYIAGMSLAEHINTISGPIPTAKALPWFKDILSALIYAKQHQIEGGAIFTEHILITENKEIKILDTALSAFYQQYLWQHHQSKILPFVSPEQLKGEARTPATDVYAAGCLLYHMLTGRQAYEGFDKEVLTFKIVEEELPPMKSYYPMVEEGLEVLVQKATARKPAERYANLEEFLQAIQKFDLEKEKNKAKPIINVVGENQEPRTTIATPTKTPAQPVEERFVNVPLFALILLAILTVILYNNFQTPEKTLKSEVVFDLQDSRSIQRKQDSIAKAKEEKRLQDSLRVSQKRQVKDTVQIFIHKVKAGETLESLSRRYYIPIDTLRKMNDMHQTRKNERLEPKYGLRVRVRDIYKLREDEGINSVAAKYKVSRMVLIQTNDIKSEEEDLFEGKTIVIPLIAPVQN